MGCRPASEPESALSTLVEAERAFARASVEQGLRHAFLEYLADDAVVFRPTPVNGKAWYAERPEAPGTLDWQPIFADVSQAGDMGYTTGPWTYSLSDSAGEQVSHGHYVSVWRKQADGSWQVALDAGVSHAPPETPVYDNRFRSSSDVRQAKSYEDDALEALQASLLAADRALSAAMAEQGVAAAWNEVSDEVGRFYREGRYPAVGQVSMQALLAAMAGAWTWEPVAAHAARSGDLGYTYGLATLKIEMADAIEDIPGGYLRIWKRQPEGEWRVVLDLASPVPPST